MAIQRMDNVLIVVDDLDELVARLRRRGVEQLGRDRRVRADPLRKKKEKKARSSQ